MCKLLANFGEKYNKFIFLKQNRKYFCNQMMAFAGTFIFVVLDIVKID
jgi:hypothetical protein